MQQIWTSVLAFLYPRSCLGCATALDTAEAFCPSCIKLVQYVTPPLCLCCGVPFTAAGPDHVCGRCLTSPPAFRQARAWACYENGKSAIQPLSEAIQRFKYQRNLGNGSLLATLGAAHFPLKAQEYDLILPVPLHLDRLRWRGFNQAWVLSKAIGRAYGIPVDPFLLARTRPTLPQTQLNERDRRANVQGAFTVTDPGRLGGKHILLVDDVYTSGATVQECAKTLRQNGVRWVDVFTLARVVFHSFSEG